MKRWGLLGALALLLGACAPDRNAAYCAAPTGDGPGSRFPRCAVDDECGRSMYAGAECNGTSRGMWGRCEYRCGSLMAGAMCPTGLRCIRDYCTPNECRNAAGQNDDSMCAASEECREGLCGPMVCPAP